MTERTERQEERLSIINSLVGNIEGYGEANIDKKALENIDFAYAALFHILKQFMNNASYGGFEGSRIDLKVKSIEVLRSIKEDIEFALSDEVPQYYWEREV